MKTVELLLDEMSLVRIEPSEECCEIWPGESINFDLGDKVDLVKFCCEGRKVIICTGYVVGWDHGSDYILYIRNLTDEEHQDLLAEEKNESN